MIVNVHKHKLVCGSIGKISVFARDAVFNRVFKPASYSILCHRENIELLGDKYVSIQDKRTEKFSEFAATIYDSNFKDIKEFYRFDANIWRRGKKYNPVRLKDRWIYPGDFPAWQKFQIVDDKIYIQTYKRNKEGENKFFIMDLKGKLLKELEVPLAEIYAFTPCPYTINRGKIYQLVENKNTDEWELHIKEIL